MGSIDKNSPAELINLQVNDRVISINNIKINNFEDIYNFMKMKTRLRFFII